MNASPIRHILFDLGGTLMHSRGDWMPIFERADQALTNKLREHHITLDTKIFRARMHEYYAQGDKDFQETTYHFVLRELLKELGYGDVAESVVRSALDAMFSVTQSNWVLEDDALGIIQKLKSDDYHLGIFSNAGDDQDVRNLVKKFGIHSDFDFVLTSAATRRLRWHRRIRDRACTVEHLARRCNHDRRQSRSGYFRRKEFGDANDLDHTPRTIYCG